MEASRLLVLVAALGCGLVGGVFFAFSTFVMPALGRLPAPGAIAAMQAINVAAVRPALMLALFGTAGACVGVLVRAVLRWGEPGAASLAAGSLAYLVGTVLVTIVCNVPRNEALAVVEPDGDDGTRLWAGYLRGWTAWNHVRTAGALAAAVLLTLGLLAMLRA